VLTAWLGGSSLLLRPTGRAIRYALRLIFARFWTEKRRIVAETQPNANFFRDHANRALEVVFFDQAAAKKRVHCECCNSVTPVSFTHMK